ncbi:Uncharacterised protein [Raoultella terrigena]|uniref:Uncharacterized protein n=1 Tax=Raoultella terrigena TaxID=577 RepID=A0A4U9D3V2_RAOTE|nr:Uncharacterised protein [Raoultella terrigena]
MKAIMLMFDSLNKRLLSTYGSDRAITPNFQRLRERTVRLITFTLAACRVCPPVESCIPGATIFSIVAGRRSSHSMILSRKY